MKPTQFTLSSSAALLSMSLILGCGDKTAQPPAQQSGAASEFDHGHSHDGEADHGHPHEGDGGHSHGAGPHDGTLADWGGGKYHVEFTVNHDKKEATVYILGSDEKTPEPIMAESLLLTINEPQLQTDLLPVPLDGESDGKSSRFVGTHDSLATVMEYEGIISAEVDGTPYAGNFKEELHDHASHGHSHGADDALVWEGEPKEHAGLVIKLGHHGTHLHAGEEVEPAVSITRDGEPVSDAKVFNALVSGDGQTVLVEEIATVYEPTTDEEPAHYSQGAFAIPEDPTNVVIRFRIVAADADEVTFDVPLSVE
ncbi:MAG: hypothetical protein KDA93_27895 [Planctomycetaceae bacterium]|nr:hypothetical protein [Planctomycetaceae bacterium]